MDWVCILMIDKVNVEHGVTMIAGKNGRRLGSLALQDPLDAVFIDDRRVTHGVTPIYRIDPSRTGHRDVLVLTFDAPGAMVSGLNPSRAVA